MPSRLIFALTLRWAEHDTPIPIGQEAPWRGNALHRIKEEGLESLWKRIATIARATREGGAAIGMATFAADPVDSVTALCVPDGIDEPALRKTMRQQHGMQIAGGQDHLKGKIIRIGHMGYLDQFDALSVLSALELAMLGQGHKVEAGAAVAAAQRVFAGS